MLIGTFHPVDEGYAGYIQTLSFGRQAAVFVPLDEANTQFDVLFISANNQTPIKFGSARKHKAKAREFLRVRLDCPALAAPVEAVMWLKASRTGTYLLEWERNAAAPKKRK